MTELPFCLSCGVPSSDPLHPHHLLRVAKEAWRNNSRCIGRLLWNSLELLDARDAATPQEIFDACVAHLRFSTNGGKIRSAVTVFNRTIVDDQSIRIWNRQLIRYAGYRLPDGSILGDPEQVEFTHKVRTLGWKPPQLPSPFDILPLVIQMPGRAPEIFTLPADSVMEVPMIHPEFSWFAELRLKWHALPVISDMALVEGDLCYPATLFSGFYMGTEIASRNFGDESRYHLLPLIAEKMGLDRNSRSILWKDRALVELNTAVLHSFKVAGVTMIDHHTASAQFMQHIKNEERCGRDIPGDWSWLVPPMAGSACPVFHRYYAENIGGAAFVSQPRPW